MYKIFLIIVFASLVQAQEPIDEIKFKAKQGYVEAQYQLGMEYKKGETIERDDVVAFYWLQLAAKKGHVKAQKSLARMYYYGEGVFRSYKMAIYWYKISADQGDAEAQYNLGEMYRKGRGVEINLKEAFDWHMMAAMQGYLYAQMRVALMYEKGEGVRKHSTLAYAWMAVATFNDLPFVRSKDSFIRLLPSDQIAKTEKKSQKLLQGIEKNKKRISKSKQSDTDECEYAF